MTDNHKKAPPRYTCNEYREEMILLGLRQRLQKKDLTEEDRIKLSKEIDRLEKAIGL